MLAPLVSTNPLAQLAKKAIKCQFMKAQDHERASVESTWAQQGYTLLSDKCHLGGNPMLPPDFVWPCVSYGNNKVQRPLVFSLQIDLSELAPFDEDNLLPHKGLLVLFTIGEMFEVNDFEDQSRFYIFEDLSSLVETSRPEEPPFNDEAEAEVVTLPWCYLGVRTCWTVPEEYSEIFNEDAETFKDQVNGFGLSKEQVIDISANYESYYQELMDKDSFVEPDEVESQFLGWGQYIQSDYVGSDNETLFFTLSSFFDEQTHDWPLCIGDAGAIYHFIDVADLKNQNFSAIRSIMDCY